MAYAIAGSPLLDSYARYQCAQGIENNNLMAGTENYFLNDDAIQEVPGDFLKGARMPPAPVADYSVEPRHEHPDVDATQLHSEGWQGDRPRSGGR